MSEATSTVEVIDVDLNLISPDPTNPRGKLRDIDQLAASFEAVGQLTPIALRPDPDKPGRYVIDVEGHRRLAAGKRAKFTTLRAIVSMNGSDEQARALTRMVSNVQRDDFTPTEEARGVQQLLDLGLDESAIAAGLSVDAGRIAGAVKVAKSAKASAIAEKHELTFDQAVTLAEFDDEKDVLVHLTQLAVKNPGAFEQTAARYRRDHTRNQLIADATAKAKEEGRVVVDDVGWRDLDPIARLDSLLDPKTDKRITTAKHRKCEGSAVYVSIDHNDKVVVEEVCTDWKAHGHKHCFAASRSGSIATTLKSAAQQERETAERREHRAGMESSRAATDVRRAFVKEMLTRKVAPKGLVPFVVSQIVTEQSGMESRQTSLFGELVGIKAENSYGEHVRVQQKFLRTLTGGRDLYVLLARVAAEREWEWDANTWRSTDQKRVGYLGFLALNGYVLSTVEKVATGKAKAETVLKEREEEKARLKSSAKLTGAVKKAAAATAKDSTARGAPRKRVPAKKAAKRRAPAKRAARR